MISKAHTGEIYTTRCLALQLKAHVENKHQPYYVFQMQVRLPQMKMKLGSLSDFSGERPIVYLVVRNWSEVNKFFGSRDHVQFKRAARLLFQSHLLRDRL